MVMSLKIKNDNSLFKKSDKHFSSNFYWATLMFCFKSYGLIAKNNETVKLSNNKKIVLYPRGNLHTNDLLNYL